MYKLILHRSAVKKLDKVPQNLRVRILNALDFLRQNHYLGKKLHGVLEGSHRIRVGDFRIIFDINEETETLIVHAIGSRGDIYK